LFLPAAARAHESGNYRERHPSGSPST
jgi:hypothetical protein